VKPIRILHKFFHVLGAQLCRLSPVDAQLRILLPLKPGHGENNLTLFTMLCCFIVLRAEQSMHVSWA